MSSAFEISTIFPASPERLYAAWLDSAQHSAMTGGSAQVSAEPGAAFNAWDGYIHGRNLELDPGRRIVQAWRTAEFASDEPDSRLEILLESVEGGTRLTLRHTQLPEHGMKYKQGWVEAYFDPMHEYFKD